MRTALESCVPIPLDQLEASLETPAVVAIVRFVNLAFVQLQSSIGPNTADSFRRHAGFPGSNFGIKEMDFRNSIVARVVIWLMAVTVPAQSLPAADCGCGEACIHRAVKAQTRTKACCCSQVKRDAGECCCCKKRSAPPTCCRQEFENSVSDCCCGDDCRCGESEPSPPFAPVSQETLKEKIARQVHFAEGMFFIPLARTAEGDCIVCSSTDGSSAADRCAALCRFTL